MTSRRSLPVRRRQLVLDPLGDHLMLVDLVEPLTTGETFDMTLEFATPATYGRGRGAGRRAVRASSAAWPAVGSAAPRRWPVTCVRMAAVAAPTTAAAHATLPPTSTLPG